MSEPKDSCVQPAKGPISATETKSAQPETQKGRLDQVCERDVADAHELATLGFRRLCMRERTRHKSADRPEHRQKRAESCENPAGAEPSVRR